MFFGNVSPPEISVSFLDVMPQAEDKPTARTPTKRKKDSEGRCLPNLRFGREQRAVPAAIWIAATKMRSRVAISQGFLWPMWALCDPYMLDFTAGQSKYELAKFDLEQGHWTWLVRERAKDDLEQGHWTWLVRERAKDDTD